MKPLYKFLIVALILGIIAWVIYFILSRPASHVNENLATNTENVETTTEQAKQTNKTEENTETPQTTEDYFVEYEPSPSELIAFSEIKKISDSPALFYWYYQKNNRIFYITEKGEIKKIIDQKNESIQINPIQDVSVARPNQDGSYVLIKFVDKSNVVWGIFSSMDEKITPLSSSIEDAVWDSNNKDIIATWNQGGKMSVVSLSAEKNFSNTSIIIPEIQMYDVDLLKKSQDELLFLEKAGDGYATSIWQYNIKTKSFTTIRKGLFDFSLHPTKDVYFFASKADGFVIADNSFEKIMPTIQKTFPEKCTSDSEIAFCFVPQTSVSYFPWIMNSTFTKDVLYMYDLHSEIEKEIPIPKKDEITIDAKDVFSNIRSIFFINKYDNFIYEIH